MTFGMPSSLNSTATPPLSTVAQSGPTYDNQPVFQFSGGPWNSVGHAGMPDKWQFPWVTVEWV